MSAGEVCDRPEPHVHHTVGPVLVVFDGVTLVLDRQIVGLFPSHDSVVAARCVELLKRYGLVDVPDTPAEVACPWPPPNPDERLCN